MERKRIRKRYIIGVIAIMLVLWRCTDSNDDEYARQQEAQAADDARYQANQEAQAAGQAQPYAPAPQPIIVNTPAQESHDHFWDYVMLHHLLNHHHEPVYRPRYQARTQNVTNITNVTHVHQAPQNFTAPAAPKKYDAPVKQPSSKWSQTGTLARNYTVSAPAPSSMKSRTWATSSGKGWGSTTSYKPRSTSYSFRSGSRSFRSSGRR